MQKIKVRPMNLFLQLSLNFPSCTATERPTSSSEDLKSEDSLFYSNPSPLLSTYSNTTPGKHKLNQSPNHNVT